VIDAGHGESVKSKNSKMAILISKYKDLRYLKKVSFIMQNYKKRRNKI